jgi:hypothetical protein
MFETTFPLEPILTPIIFKLLTITMVTKIKTCDYHKTFDKENQVFFPNFHMSTISSLSNLVSNSSNSFFKSTFISMISTKLKGALQPTLRSLYQFLLTNINFF